MLFKTHFKWTLSKRTIEPFAVMSGADNINPLLTRAEFRVSWSIQGSSEISSKMCKISTITAANSTPEKKKCAPAHFKFFKSKPGSVFFF